MVLDFGLLQSGLFPQSEALGDGFGANQDAQIVWTDVGKGIHKILTIDNTGDLDVSKSTANKSYVISADNLINVNWLIIELIGKFEIRSQGAQSGSIDVKMEATAPAAVTYVDEQIARGAGTAGDQSHVWFHEYKYVRTLSEAEKNSGVTIKITTASSGTASPVAFISKHIILTGMG